MAEARVNQTAVQSASSTRALHSIRMDSEENNWSIPGKERPSLWRDRRHQVRSRDQRTRTRFKEASQWRPTGQREAKVRKSTRSVGKQDEVFHGVAKGVQGDFVGMWSLAELISCNWRFAILHSSSGSVLDEWPPGPVAAGGQRSARARRAQVFIVLQ